MRGACRHPQNIVCRVKERPHLLTCDSNRTTVTRQLLEDFRQELGVPGLNPQKRLVSKEASGLPGYRHRKLRTPPLTPGELVGRPVEQGTDIEQCYGFFDLVATKMILDGSEMLTQRQRPTQQGMFRKKE
jgi:hypothetical protein